METRHVRLEYAQGLNGKKQILSSQIGLIYISKVLLRYKMLRKKEFALKNKLKRSVGSLKTKLNTFSSSLPVTPKTSIIHKAVKKQSHENKESKDLSEELKDIQRKLAKLQ